MSATLAPTFADRLVADIAASLPGASAVFRQHKLDFCCNGKVPLAEAAAAHGLPLASLEAALARLSEGPGDQPQDTGALIDMIEERFHATHRRELPELVRLARRVEAVHQGHAEAPKGLADHLAQMQEELEDHMQKEEQVLFPLFRRGGHPMIMHPIGAMRAEHDCHTEQLARLEAWTHGGQTPAGACPTWQALYAGTRKLVADLQQHIHVENDVLFPRFGG